MATAGEVLARKLLVTLLEEKLAKFERLAHEKEWTASFGTAPFGGLQDEISKNKALIAAAEAARTMSLHDPCRVAGCTCKSFENALYDTHKCFWCFHLNTQHY